MKGSVPVIGNPRMSTTPIAVPRTRRVHTCRGITTIPAGKMVPISAIPLLREDSIRSGRLRFNLESMETAEMLMNAINVRFSAYLVPTLAFDRFEGSMDQLNRSWEGKAFKELPVVPYVETQPFGAHGSNEIYKYLGLHATTAATPVNTMYLEAYNQIWNFRAANRSPDIEKRERLDTTLAPAFWMHERFKHIVPDFDQAAIDGQVAFNVVNERLPVKGLSYIASTNSGAGGHKNGVHENQAMRESSGAPRQFSKSIATSEAGAFRVDMKNALPVGSGLGAGFDMRTAVADIYAELAGVGISLSLSSIDLARKTQAFAKLRMQYSGHDDDYLINMLMDGLTIPEQAFAQPMLIGEKTTVFGMAKRYASDSGNLTESVVEGATFVDMAIQLPRIPVGGVVMIVAEIMPDQLFERQKDPFFHAQNVDAFPHYLRDTLDPEKVEVVPCSFVDVDHDTPNSTFGYAPLNYAWNMEQPKVGGYMYRPKVDAGFSEDRQRIWAVETKNPTLSKDFYLCTNIHTKPFVVTNRDPFECVTQGDILIEGNTVFGGVLLEANGDYDAVMAEAPTERIVK